MCCCDGHRPNGPGSRHSRQSGYHKELFSAPPSLRQKPPQRKDNQHCEQFGIIANFTSSKATSNTCLEERGIHSTRAAQLHARMLFRVEHLLHQLLGSTPLAGHAIAHPAAGLMTQPIQRTPAACLLVKQQCTHLSNTVRICSAGLHLSFKMSKHMRPSLSMLG